MKNQSEKSAPQPHGCGNSRRGARGNTDRAWCLKQCLVMGAWWVLRYLLHTLSTTLSHHAIGQDGIYRRFVVERRQAAGWKVVA